ncbi:hypothetical protein LTR62_007553 [Meristemomyces frigidus]|uniref:N-alpha-acetyltransferase 40 n=1 Tax=Meristemomyces frigidus TaxID=1508187 RepID=A0AAN7TAL8_9PEZI|nr:hypothetical protein LTR62_007553 [Meristemomyces frigidus]
MHEDERPAKRRKTDDPVERLAATPIADLQEKYLNNGQLLYELHKPTQTTEEPTKDEQFHTYTIALKTAFDLSDSELSTCFNLIDSTSRPDYASSTFGWHPKRKCKEMLDKDMRYLLIRRQPPPLNSTTEPEPEPEPVQAFLSFMFTYDSDPPVPVLYIYEIHLAAPLRRIGLGAHLMQIVEVLAAQVGVRKVMLTCFLSNAKALRFYRQRGYEADVCSPPDRLTRRKVVKADYVIMSRDVEGEAEAF